MYRGDERVFFQVHGLPSVLKLKIALDSPFHHLFDHIPAKRYQPANTSGPEYTWGSDNTVLDPLKTPADYQMEPGDKSVHVITVNFPPLPVHNASNPRTLFADDERGDQVDTPGRGLAPLGSGRPSIDAGDRRSPLLSGRQQQEASFASARSPRVTTTGAMASVDKIIDDLTQALRVAEDEIEDLQQRVDEKQREVRELAAHTDVKRVTDLENENRRLKADLELERRENDSKQEAIQILRNKISALEAAANRSLDQVSLTPPTPAASSGLNTAGAAEALATSLRHHCHSLEEELSHREEEIRHLNQRMEQLRKELSEQAVAYEQLAKQKQETNEKLDATRVAMTKVDERALNTVDDCKVRIDRLERENAILQSDNTTLAQRVVAAEQQKSDLRSLRNEFDLEKAAWGAQKSALEKENKSLREKCADQLLQSQRHEKVLAERNASLQEKIAFFEDPRSVNQREEEFQQREIEMRARLRDTLAENERLKTVQKDLRRQVSELETSLFECNNVLVRVQKENTDLKRGGVSSTSVSSTPRFESRLPAAARTTSSVASPYSNSPLPAVTPSSAMKPGDNVLLHTDPFSLIKGLPGVSSPNIADTLLLSRHNSVPTAMETNNGVPRSNSSFQEAEH